MLFIKLHITAPSGVVVLSSHYVPSTLASILLIFIPRCVKGSMITLCVCVCVCNFLLVEVLAP